MTTATQGKTVELKVLAVSRKERPKPHGFKVSGRQGEEWINTFDNKILEVKKGERIQCDVSRNKFGLRADNLVLVEQLQDDFPGDLPDMREPQDNWKQPDYEAALDTGPLPAELTGQEVREGPPEQRPREPMRGPDQGFTQTQTALQPTREWIQKNAELMNEALAKARSLADTHFDRSGQRGQTAGSYVNNAAQVITELAIAIYRGPK